DYVRRVVPVPACRSVLHYWHQNNLLYWARSYIFQGESLKVNLVDPDAGQYSHGESQRSQFLHHWPELPDPFHLNLCICLYLLKGETGIGVNQSVINLA